MSTYPGDNPQQPEDQRPADETSDAEPTQPVGYWERQAAEKRAREQGQQPTTPYPQGYPGQAAAPQNPYGAPPQHHGYPPPPPASVPSAPPASPPPGQAGPYAPPPLPPGAYGPPPPGTYPAQAYGYRAPAPDHPQSTLSLVLGLVGLIGAFVFCGLPLVVSPFAWALGRNALKEIRASGGRLGGESQARTGMILGIIGTVLAVLALLGLVAFIVAVAATDSTSSTGSSV